MNRIFYDGQATQGAGGNGEIPEADLDTLKDIALERKIHFFGNVLNLESTNFIKGYLECLKDNYRRHLSPSPGLRWVKASERPPSKRTNCFVMVYAPLFQYNYKATRLWDGNKWIDEIDGRTDPVVEWLDESPSLPGEQETDLMAKAIQMRDAYNSYIGTLAAELFVFRGGKIRGAPVDHFKEQENARLSLSEALKPFVGGTAKTFGSPPSAEKGEQVEGKDVPDIHVGDIAKSADNQPSVEADQQVPEENPFAHNEEIECLKAEVEAYKKTATLMGEEANTLRSSGQIALSEYKRDMEIAKGERDDAKQATIDRLYQQILASGEPFSPAIREVFHKEMNGLKTFTNNTKD